MNLRNKLIIYTVMLAVIDTVIPVPVTGLLLIYVLLKKPIWFKKSVFEVYNA
jgi:hypothetical protein